MTLKNIINLASPILKSHGVKRAAIFGSYARQEQTKRSDIDILVEMKRGSSLIDLMTIEGELKDKLDRKVDLLTYNSLHPRLKSRILKESKPIL